MGREQWLTYRMRGKKAWENASRWHGCVGCDDQQFRPLGLNDMTEVGRGTTIFEIRCWHCDVINAWWGAFQTI